jgi:hypothetical protein
VMELHAISRARKEKGPPLPFRNDGPFLLTIQFYPLLYLGHVVVDIQ